MIPAGNDKSSGVVRNAGSLGPCMAEALGLPRRSSECSSDSTPRCSVTTGVFSWANSATQSNKAASAGRTNQQMHAEGLNAKNMFATLINSLEFDFPPTSATRRPASNESRLFILKITLIIIVLNSLCRLSCFIIQFFFFFEVEFYGTPVEILLQNYTEFNINWISKDDLLLCNYQSISVLNWKQMLNQSGFPLNSFVVV